MNGSRARRARATEEWRKRVVNKDLTLTAALLDRTGSMATCRRATEDGFNEFINGQKQEPGRTIVTLAQFDSHAGCTLATEFVYRNRPIDEVPPLVLSPRGMTPLLDAVGEFVTGIGEDLAKLPDEERPGLVICLIMTDGHENASIEWTWERVRDLIEQQRRQWQWQFVFLGANIDAVKVGERLGVAQAASMTFNAADSDAVADSFRSVSNYASGLRGADAVFFASAGFSEEDRQRSMGKR